MISEQKLKILRTEIEMRGYLKTLRVALCWGINKLLLPKQSDFDKQYGTTTNDLVEVADGDIPAEAVDDAVRYVPTNPEVIQHICRRLKIDHERFIFPDLGSGRGRALLSASDFPFKKIIGVEISSKHHQMADKNVTIYRSPKQRCSAIETVCDNVVDFHIPCENLVVYLYQPFGGSILQKVLANIQASVSDDHEVFLCFSAPYKFQDLILDSTYFQFIEHFPTTDREDTWTLYGNTKAMRKFHDSDI